MKPKFFIGLAAGIVVIAASVCITVSGENNTPKMSDLMTKNLEALTQNENGSGGGTLWCREDFDCTYIFQGEAGATITVAGVKIKIGADGMASYTIPKGSTECSFGGNQQCEARYCPSTPF